ncbi:Uma2 family endonuclease [Glycomyces arizonensis]|uniref:Uma2 family endonuclease n=1 Tax=Glycomyces arizonensis TaxID=256035 RepID=UPI0006890A92|nr:Uma2 family endonuclease [Glycomyces arizonensis]
MVMNLQKRDNEALSYDERSEGFGYMVETASELDLPDGLNAEVFGRNIVVSPWSKAYYGTGMMSLLDQLNAHAPDGHKAREAPFLFVFPEWGALGPDVYVLETDMMNIDSNQIPGEALSLVAELTSTATRDNDRNQKKDIYGRSGVPVYLLFDMKERALTVYSDPSRKRGYQAQVTVDFGKSAYVPEPFDFELDTSAFKSQP